MPPSTWPRASASTTTTAHVSMTSLKRVISPRRRDCTGNRSYREPSNFSDDDTDFLSRSSSSTPAPTAGLKEARELCQNNLRLAWESIFTRYSQGDHLAAGRDDVFDFGTGEIVEDAGFLNDFIVEDDDIVFEGRSIEIGDFGLPGASGMHDLTDSSEEAEDETPVRSRRSSLKSESNSEQEDGSGDDLLLANSPSSSRREGTSIRPAARDSNSRSIPRSISMPESIDLLSSSDDEMGQRDIHPVSNKYKEIKRIRTSMKEDLLEFREAEAARQAKEVAEKVKRERTCTPFLGLANAAHLRAQFTRPLSRSAPSTFRPYVPSSLARQTSITPSKPPRYPTPSSASSSYIYVKPESSCSSSLDIKPFRASSSRPQGRCFSGKPSSSSSSAPMSSISAIPLAHYSNTLLNQAVAAEEDSSDDELAIRSRSVRIADQDRVVSQTDYPGKGKERAKDEDQDMDSVFFHGSRDLKTNIPSSPISRLPPSRKRSPTFFSDPTPSTLPPLQPAHTRRPIIEIAQSASRLPPAPHLAQSTPTRQHAHAIPKVPSSRLEQYRPKQPSPLKRSSSQHHRLSANDHSPSAPQSLSVIDISSSDEDDDVPLRNLVIEPASQTTIASTQSIKKEEARARAVYISPSKRKYSTSPEAFQFPTARARMVPPTPPRSFSSACSSLPSLDSTTPVTPSVPLEKMSLTTSSSAPAFTALGRLPKEETPNAFASLATKKVKREDSVLPPVSAATSIAYPSHLPTPPLSSGSATASTRCKEETPSVKPEENQEVSKAPLPRQKPSRKPSIAAKRWSTPSLAIALNRDAGKIRQETPSLDSPSDDDDEIMLISPSRGIASRREIISTPGINEGDPIRTANRARLASVLTTSPQRGRSVAGPTVKASPTVMRDRPPSTSDGYESDDPLAI